MIEHDNHGIAGPAAPAAHPLLTCPGGRKPRLLLAEDSNTARILTAALLKRMGADVDTAEHGEEALDHVRLNKYDLVLLDIEMPVMDGVSAAREIRALEGVAGKTPLMALSAFLADSAKCGSWRESFDHALPKPAGRSELHSAIQFVLNTRGARRMDAAVMALAADPSMLVHQAAMVEAKRQIGAEVWNELLNVAIAEMQGSIRRLKASLESRDRAAVKREAHKLKGIASSFAAPMLAALAELFETGCAAWNAEECDEKSAELRRVVNRTTAALAALNAN
jgi:CheY-like chemotaxis protein